jgi:hypothetical protein
VSHGDFVRPSHQWAGEMVPGQADYQRLDVAQWKSVNVTDGNATYTPTGPVIIGGAGMSLTNASSRLQGGAQTALGGRVILGTGDNGFPVLSSIRTRTITWRLFDAPGMLFGDQSPNSMRDENYALPSYALQGQAPVPLGLAFSAAFLAGGGVTQLSIPRRYIHTGASISSISMQLRLTSRPTSVPAPNALPNFILTAFNAGATALQTINPDRYVGGNMGVWQLNHSYPLNSYVSPTNPNLNGYWFKATSISGTGTSSNTTEPVWPNIINNTVTDNPGANQIVWTCAGRIGMLFPPSSVDTFYNGGQPQTVTFDFDGTNTLDATAWKYVLLIGGLQPYIMIHSISMLFVYSVLSFE